MEDGGWKMEDAGCRIQEYIYKKKNVEVHGHVVHTDQGCHGIVLWPWDVNFSMPSTKIRKKIMS